MQTSLSPENGVKQQMELNKRIQLTQVNQTGHVKLTITRNCSTILRKFDGLRTATIASNNRYQHRCFNRVQLQ